jgi:hypothetical protein
MSLLSCDSQPIRINPKFPQPLRQALSTLAFAFRVLAFAFRVLALAFRALRSCWNHYTFSVTPPQPCAVQLLKRAFP